ncbi:MAG: hypothetical protein ACYC67_10335 [Prosthecobacter sp.]
MHQLILDMGFIQTSPGPHDTGPEYYHAKHKLTFRPVPTLDKAGLAEALIMGGMAVQKLETIEVISKAAKKLGFKF